jgi:hypothetical protein
MSGGHVERGGFVRLPSNPAYGPERRVKRGLCPVTVAEPT